MEGDSKQARRGPVVLLNRSGLGTAALARAGAALATWVVVVMSIRFWHVKTSNRFDGAVDDLFRAEHGTLTRAVFSVITGVGSPRIALPVAVVVAALAWWAFRRWKLALFAPTVFAVTSVTARLLKIAVARQRPDSRVSIDPSLYAFPSGHAAAAGAVMLSAAVLVMLSGVRGRRPLAALLVLAAVAGGASRVVVGAHYTTDVIGGFALAVAVVLLATSFLLDAGKGPKPLSRRAS